MIAKDLYRVRKEVERIEKALTEAAGEERGRLEEELRRAKAEQRRLQEILDGAKEPPPYRQPR